MSAQFGKGVDAGTAADYLREIAKAESELALIDRAILFIAEAPAMATGARTWAGAYRDGASGARRVCEGSGRGF